MLQLQVHLSQVLHFGVPEILEAYRGLVGRAGIPYLTPARLDTTKVGRIQTH